MPGPTISSPRKNQSRNGDAAAAGGASFRTLALGLALKEAPRPEGKCRLLDLGPPMTGNVAALAGTGCKVFVDDLASAITGLGGTGRQGVRDDHIAELLGGTRKESVDLVLAWNLFNYLPMPTISVLAGRLRECCTSGALIHFLLYNTQSMPGEPGRFRIAAGGMLEFEADSAMTVASPRHSPRTLQENMPGFDIYRMFLLGSGNQECLFVAV